MFNEKVLTSQRGNEAVVQKRYPILKVRYNKTVMKLRPCYNSESSYYIIRFTPVIPCYDTGTKLSNGLINSITNISK